jgi:hypothetical protein
MLTLTIRAFPRPLTLSANATHNAPHVDRLVDKPRHKR